MIVSLKEYKEFLKISISNPDDDAVLQKLCEESEGFLKGYLNRELEIFEYTEYFDGGSNVVLPNQYPISEVYSIEVFEDDWNEWEEGNQYHRLVVMPTMILIEGTKFPKGNQNIRINYSAGYDETTMPLELKMRAKELFYLYYNEFEGQRSLGVSSINKSGAGINDIFTIDKDETGRILRHLDKYRLINA